MKIFAISVVKNEADIVAKSLLEATSWADKIFVLDNGSTDGTWEIVQGLASDKIIPWKRDLTPFYDGIRAQVYQEFKHLAKEGDWWCFRLDADEFYVDNPVNFLQNVPKHHHFVVTDTIQFRLTKDDFKDGKSPKSIEDIRYYDKKTWSEARFFRHRDKMEWTPAMERPKRMGVMHPKRIKLRHYQFRSLDQIKQRIAVRIEAKRNGHPGFDYSINENIDTYLHNREELYYFDGGNQWTLDGPQNHLFQRKYDVIIKTIFHALGIYK
ncbi:glycosyltransferase family 2 protein [Hymenobacter caeli]|uniref:Glycosyltransferase involved in cell wall biosynthesis n=1 Tax=Hymenobacter caeli TaxID=2735894 RepID=A0ABX2FJI2_9BACT|nr:glycosyltransferase family 2 protein [Hymenobacter caeli]NRT17278.1 glycosyltransferase involved in cell wall biosynthesis [Hymenobacter caeli]